MNNTIADLNNNKKHALVPTVLDETVWDHILCRIVDSLAVILYSTSISGYYCNRGVELSGVIAAPHYVIVSILPHMLFPAISPGCLHEDQHCTVQLHLNSRSSP